MHIEDLGSLINGLKMVGAFLMASVLVMSGWIRASKNLFAMEMASILFRSDGVTFMWPFFRGVQDSYGSVQVRRCTPRQLYVL